MKIQAIFNSSYSYNVEKKRKQKNLNLKTQADSFNFKSKQQSFKGFLPSCFKRFLPSFLNKLSKNQQEEFEIIVVTVHNGSKYTYTSNLVTKTGSVKKQAENLSERIDTMKNEINNEIKGNQDNKKVIT